MTVCGWGWVWTLVVGRAGIEMTIELKLISKVMGEIYATSIYSFEGKVVDSSLHANSLSHAVTKLCSRHPDKFDGLFTMRRTCKALMSVDKLSKELRGRIQGHVFDDTASKHYDRYDDFEEK